MRYIFNLIFILSATAAHAQQTNSFMIFGDTHYYSPSPNFKESILYELTLKAIDEKVDFVFITGDLVLRDGGVDADYDSLLADWKFVIDTLDVNGIRLFACRGNNDVNSAIAWQTLFSGEYSLPGNGPEGELYKTYSLEYDNYLFLSLDQYSEYNKVNQTWIDEQLNMNSKPFVFAASHEPAFEVFQMGLSRYPKERDGFWESFTNASGKIYFCGHSHFYDHSILIDDDDYPGNDAHQIIAGTGGTYFHSDSIYSNENGRWQMQLLHHEKSYGYVLVEVDESGFRTFWKHRIAPFTFEADGDNYNYSVTSVFDDKIIPSEFKLFQNYPNPFNPATLIQYSIPAVKALSASTRLSTGAVEGLVNSSNGNGLKSRGDFAKVRLVIYDVLGREVETLVNKQQRPGHYEVKWDASNFSSGIYFYRLTAGQYINTKKMLFLK